MSLHEAAAAIVETKCGAEGAQRDQGEKQGEVSEYSVGLVVGEEIRPKATGVVRDKRVRSDIGLAVEVSSNDVSSGAIEDFCSQMNFSV